MNYFLWAIAQSLVCSAKTSRDGEVSNLGFELLMQITGCTLNVQPANLHNIFSHRKACHAKLRTGRTVACEASVSVAKNASNGRKTLMKRLLRRLDELVEVFSILCISSLLIKAQLELSGTINVNRRTYTSVKDFLIKI